MKARARNPTPIDRRSRLAREIASLLSHQALDLLYQVAKLGLYGTTAGEVAVRMVDAALIGLADSPALITLPAVAPRKKAARS